MKRYIGIVLFFMLLAGCASGIQGARTERPTAIVEGVPLYPQEEYQCGPASLASVLNYYGVPVTPEEVAAKVYSRSARGALTIDLVLYAGSKGLEASSYSGGPDDLRKRIDEGKPVIVLVDYGFSIVQANHFMVVVGYNGDGVIVNSGRQEKKFIPFDDFLKSWERTKFMTLLINRK